jgi:hypothetical protein
MWDWFIVSCTFWYTGAFSSSTAASDAHAGVRLVLSGTDTTDTKAAKLKSLQDGIEHALHKRREVLALLQTERKTLYDRMEVLASQSFLPLISTVISPFILISPCVSGRQV